MGRNDRYAGDPAARGAKRWISPKSLALWTAKDLGRAHGQAREGTTVPRRSFWETANVGEPNSASRAIYNGQR